MIKAKTSFKFIFAALAATAALAACTKEITPPNFENDKVAPAAEGSRVIAVSFGKQQTKTTLEEGLQPKFRNKDSILLVSYPADPNEKPITDTCEVKVDDNTGEATISTDLTGDLTALYPVKYAKQMPSGKFGLPVPAVQTGKFADANFCGAQIKDGEKTATFQNGTSLFIITPPSGTIRLTVKSLKQIGADGQRTGTEKPIYLSEKGDMGYSISIPNGPDTDKKYYVTLSDGVNLSDLSFEAEYETSGTGSIKGIPTSKIAEQATAAGKEYDEYNKILYGIAYTVDENNWHDYATIGGIKWATTNVGASKPEDAGYYFAWGATEVAYESFNGTNFVFKTTAPESYNSDTWDPAKGFDNCNAPSCITKYQGQTDKTLDLCDDAAYFNWGGAWRMPTKSEFESSIKNNSTVEKKYVDESTKIGYEISSGSNKIFIPKTKYGSVLKLEASFGYGVWLSWVSGDQYRFIKISNSSISHASYDYYHIGRNVRAIVDEPQSQQEVPVVFNTDLDKDGVIDPLDKCPNTPTGVSVDSQGCPLDSDSDGVPDYLDKCPGTSAEAIGKVDSDGCPLDSDGDGVPDYLDKCPGTPAAAKGHVDDNGCPLDSDGDGVNDFEDACPMVSGIKENKGCPEVK